MSETNLYRTMILYLDTLYVYSELSVRMDPNLSFQFLFSISIHTDDSQYRCAEYLRVEVLPEVVSLEILYVECLLRFQGQQS